MSEAAAQRLGFACKDIAEADAQSGIRPNLSKYFEHHPRLRAAFDRGRLLKYLVELGPNAFTWEASNRLKDLGFVQFDSPGSLRDFLDKDAEANELWETSRVNGFIENRQNLRKTAGEGNVRAIQLLDKWAVDRQQEKAGPAVDLTHLSQKEICDLFCVSRVTLGEWQSKQNLPRNTDGTYNLAEMIRWHGDFCSRKQGGRILPADKLRDLKAEEKAIDLAERRGRLRDIEEVIGGLAVRWQRIVGAFRYKRRELAMMVHGQTVERIEDALGRFFEDIQRAWCEKLPEFADVPPEAEVKLNEFLDLMVKKTDKENTEDRVQDTEKQPQMNADER